MARKGKKRSAAQRRATKRMLAGLRRRRGSGRKARHGRTRSRKGHHMAKRRSKKRGSGRRRTHHRRRRFGGGGSGMSALKHDVPKLLAAAIYGKVESLAASDDNFFLNKIPKPITAVGYTGNVALALYLLSMFVKHPYVKMGASTAAVIAAYKIGKQGKLYSSSDKGSIGEYYDGNMLEGTPEAIIDDHTMGALDAEAAEFGTQGVPFDPVVHEAQSRV